MSDNFAEKTDMVRQWLVKAEHDLRSARFLRQMPDDEITTDSICFHCQQCIEKGLKAFLVWHDVNFRKEHNLEYLQELCKRADDSFQIFEFGRMSEFGVIVRYPSEFYMPAIEEAAGAISLAEIFDEYIRRKLSDALAWT